MLIDRNDELCILYEKHNLQESILRDGELQLKKREDEMRLLRLEIQVSAVYSCQFFFRVYEMKNEQKMKTEG
jgi:hypothetical protein